MTPSTTQNKHLNKTFFRWFVLPIIGALLIVGFWSLLAYATRDVAGVILTPLETLKTIGAEAKKPNFYRAVFGTLSKSFFSFLISFSAAAVLAVASNLQKWVKSVIGPLISVFRALPTAALILILLLCVGSRMLPTAVAFLVVFPLSYQNLYAAIENVDRDLVQMTRVFGMSTARRLLHVYLPGVIPAMFSSLIASFGLNIKVVIAAEVMGLPTVSIGYMILISKQGFDFGIAFAWLVIAVLISFVCECVLRIAARLAMPYRYPDRKILKRFFCKIGRVCRRIVGRANR
ncbi:MAG: ABC transporter permease subunit [Clostridiales bacterium]|jgi:NitT/TauT family transport system permease protein|nr:ABC transporter permease subunit [Clostridiales bacterium]